MALRDFWVNVRMAVPLSTFTSTVDSPGLDAAKIEQVLRTADRWLTAKSVEGYDENDFAFLPEEQRRELTRLVHDFRQVADKVPLATPPTPAQVEQALPLFRGLVEFLEFDRYGNAEAYQAGKQIEKLIQASRPDWLRDLRFEAGTDEAGEPGLWIWAILDADGDEDFSQKAPFVYKLLWEAVRRLGLPYWPYIRMRTVEEQAEILEAQPP